MRKSNMSEDPSSVNTVDHSRITFCIITSPSLKETAGAQQVVVERPTAVGHFIGAAE